jgi:Domain of unknown function (DUF4440)
MRLSIVVLALLVVGALHASGASADDAALTAEIRARVNELNQAFADRDTAKIETMITADQIAVIPVYGKPTTFAERLPTLDKYNVVKSAFTPAKVTVLGPAAVLVTYENSNQGSYAGKPLSPRVFVSQIWVKQDGKWRQQLYQETPIAAE